MSFFVLISCNTSSDNYDKEPPKQTDFNKGKVKNIEVKTKIEPISDSSKTLVYKSNFAEVIKRVEKINYSLKKIEQIEKKENLLTFKIDRINKFRTRINSQREDGKKKLIKQVDTLNITKVQRASIKGTIELKKNLYERAVVESWEITNENEATLIFEEIEKLKRTQSWEDISKSPITCFRIRNEIIFITPGGFYMLDKVVKIKDFLKNNL
jgi:hypothetical protein